MGYDTDFTGQLEITPALTPEEAARLGGIIKARQLPFVLETYVHGWLRSFLWVSETQGRHARDEIPGCLTDFIHWHLPAGRLVNGTLEASGSDEDDLWAIVAKGNEVRVLEGTRLGVVYQAWENGEVVEPHDERHDERADELDCGPNSLSE
jgi:hypothetical protein